MPITTDNAVETALRKNDTHRHATLWTIERSDGEVLRFTDHDRPILFDSQTFQPAGGFNASARAKRTGLQEPNNLEIVGVINSDYITEADLRAGRYRDAKVTERLVDWRYPWASELMKRVYWTTDTRFSENGWEAQLEGLGRWVQPAVGRLYNRKCPHLLGDANCTVNLASYTVTGTVATVADTRRIFNGAVHAIGTDELYRHGLLSWTSGNNLGLSCEVLSYTAATRTFTLFLEMPYNIEVGDAYSVYQGCDKERTICITKFNNVINFGGFPWVPGTDKAIAAPSIPEE